MAPQRTCADYSIGNMRARVCPALRFARETPTADVAAAFPHRANRDRRARWNPRQKWRRRIPAPPEQRCLSRIAACI
jgi:hypothetical protein